MWMCNVEELEVVREIMCDERFKRHQKFSFEASLKDYSVGQPPSLWGRGKHSSLLSDWSNQMMSIVAVVYPRSSQVIHGYL